jgi:hypothetical protein
MVAVNGWLVALYVVSAVLFVGGMARSVVGLVELRHQLREPSAVGAATREIHRITEATDPLAAQEQSGTELEALGAEVGQLRAKVETIEGQGTSLLTKVAVPLIVAIIGAGAVVVAPLLGHLSDEPPHCRAFYELVLSLPEETSAPDQSVAAAEFLDDEWSRSADECGSAVELLERAGVASDGVSGG